MVIQQAESETLGVLMIDFSPIVREGLQSILNKDSGIELVGDAPDEHQAVRAIKQASTQGQPVKVVLTETRNEKLDGVQATRLIKESFPEVAVLVLTENLNDTYVIDAINAGAGGYIFLKDTAPEALLESIHRVVDGSTQIKTELSCSSDPQGSRCAEATGERGFKQANRFKAGYHSGHYQEARTKCD